MVLPPGIEPGALVPQTNILSIKPLDLRGIERIIKETDRFITIENGMISSGIGEYILSKIKPQYRSKLLFCAGFPDQFIPHGRDEDLFRKYKMDADSLAKRVIKSFKMNQ